MLYHAYIKVQSKTGRTVCLDEVKWTKGCGLILIVIVLLNKKNGPEI